MVIESVNKRIPSAMIAAVLCLLYSTASYAQARKDDLPAPAPETKDLAPAEKDLAPRKENSGPRKIDGADVNLLLLTRELMKRKRFDEALEILVGLEGDLKYDQTEVKFLQGLVLINLDRHTDATVIFREILEERPDLTRVRLELARALFFAEDDEASQRHFELVLAGEPVAPVAANIQLFLDRIRARRGFSYWFNFGFAPDTNYNSGHADDQICIGSLCGFTLSEDAQEQSGIGTFMTFGASARKPLSEEVLAIFTGSTTRWEYKSDDNDSQSMTGDVKLRFLKPQGYYETGLVGGIGIDTNNQLSYREVGLRLSHSHRSGQRMSLLEQFEVFSRRRPNPDDNNKRYRLNLNISYAIDRVTFVQIGLGATRTKGRTDIRSSFTNTTQIGIRREFGLGITLGAYVFRSRMLEDGLTALGGFRREDKSRAYTITALKRGFSFFGFAPEFSVTQSENDSNQERFIYDSVRGNLSFTRDF